MRHSSPLFHFLSGYCMKNRPLRTLFISHLGISSGNLENVPLQIDAVFRNHPSSNLCSTKAKSPELFHQKPKLGGGEAFVPAKSK